MPDDSSKLQSTTTPESVQTKASSTESAAHVSGLEEHVSGPEMPSPTPPSSLETPPLSNTVSPTDAVSPPASFESAPASGGPSALKTIGLVVLAIAVIGGLSAAGYYLGVNKILVPQATPTPKSTQTETPKPTATPYATSDLKTFTSDKFGFTFKHPNYEELKPSEAGISGPITGNPKLLVLLADKSTLSEGTDKPFDGFAVYTIDLKGETFENYIKDEVLAVVKSPRGSKDAKSVEENDGTYKWVYIDRESEIRDYFIVSKDGKYVIAFSRSSGASEAFPADFFDFVISTFTYIEPTPTPTAKDQ